VDETWGRAAASRCPPRAANRGDARAVPRSHARHRNVRRTSPSSRGHRPPPSACKTDEKDAVLIARLTAHLSARSIPTIALVTGTNARSQLRVAVAVTPRHPITVAHRHRPPTMGHQARQRIRRTFPRHFMIENDQHRPTLDDPESVTVQGFLNTTNIVQSLWRLILRLWVRVPRGPHDVFPAQRVAPGD